MNKTAEIIEIFESIQGEGLLVGVKQLFIRFCGCNLRCNYCDTAFSNGKRYTVDELMNELEKYDLEKIHSISLTGGEPLLHSEFLQGFMYKAKNKHPKLKFYLETNATLYKKINEIIEYTDIIAADIKLNSSTNQTNQFEAHEEFFKAQCVGVSVAKGGIEDRDGELQEENGKRRKQGFLQNQLAQRL